MNLGRDHWLERAHQARVVADYLDSHEAQRLMREIASRYERIAELAGATPRSLAEPSGKK